MQTENRNQVIPFNYGDSLIRTVEDENGEPLWVAKDICDVLTIKNSRDALSKLDDDEKGVVKTDTLGGTQDLRVINESGLYTLILRSNKPEAKKFKKWVTSEVLPTIRKTGSYAVNQNQDIQPFMVQLLETNQETMKAIVQLSVNMESLLKNQIRTSNDVNWMKANITEMKTTGVKVTLEKPVGGLEKLFELAERNIKLREENDYLRSRELA